MARRKRPFLTTAVVLWGAGALLIGPAVGQLFSGLPWEQGVAPIGFTVGPLLAIIGTLLFLVKKPLPERPAEPLD